MYLQIPKTTKMGALSEAIFGKSLADLNYNDMVNFFGVDHGESNRVEFKAFSAQYGNFAQNIKGIIRAICGMLNSDGGVVIWGAPLGVVDPATNEKKFVGALAPVPEYKEKDWMINKISDSITPLPTGIEIAILQQAATENTYIIEVPSSPYKPHQFDNTYFVRLDGQTKPAPHYFIEALFRRISYPNIEGYIKFEKAGLLQNPSRYYLKISIFMFNFSQLQNEENVTLRVITLPGKFQPQGNGQGSYLHIHKIPSLHFGLVDTHSEVIIIDPNELVEHDNKIILSLSFAGKHSPAKASDYIIDFAKVNLGNSCETLQMIEKAEENKLFAETQKELGTTREKSVFTAIGRNPSK